MRWKHCLTIICVPLAIMVHVTGALAQDDAPPEPEGLWQGPMNGRVPATVAGGTVIATQALAALSTGGSTVLIDVSPAPRRPEHLSSPWLPMPHRTIPGSVWIPGAGAGVISATMMGYIRARLAELTAGDRDRSIVVYCRVDCWASWNAAKRLIADGYRHVAWYPDGIEAWQDSGLPTAITEPEGPAVQ